MCRSSASRASESLGSSRSSTPGSVRRRTPGLNGTRLSFCRIRPCIQSRSGAGLRFGGQDVAAERRLADLETTLAQVRLDVQETATLLAPLLDIPLPAERAPKFGPEELRRRQLAAMVALLLAGARTQPVVLAFEDLHWADPTSLDLIQALAERGAQAPLLVVATTRPEFRAPWGMRSHHAVVALAPLDRTEVRRMVGEIAAQHALPQEVVERVSERTGGVPLFVEEVTRLLVERGDTGSQARPSHASAVARRAPRPAGRSA